MPLIRYNRSDPLIPEHRCDPARQQDVMTKESL